MPLSEKKICRNQCEAASKPSDDDLWTECVNPTNAKQSVAVFCQTTRENTFEGYFDEHLCKVLEYFCNLRMICVICAV